MKKFIILFTLLSIAIGGFAQKTEQGLKNRATKKAKEKIALITSRMILNPDDIVFLEKALTTKYLYVYTYTKNKDTTPEYKKAINAKSSEWFDDELDKYFSKEEKKDIRTNMRTNKNNKKKKKEKK